MARPARLAADAYPAGFARFPFLAFAEIHKVNDALQHFLSGVIIDRSMVEDSLSFRGDPQDLCKSGAQSCCGNFSITLESLGNQELERVRFTIIGFPQVTDMAMCYAVTGDLRALLSK